MSQRKKSPWRREWETSRRERNGAIHCEWGSEARASLGKFWFGICTWIRKYLWVYSQTKIFFKVLYHHFYWILVCFYWNPLMKRTRLPRVESLATVLFGHLLVSRNYCQMVPQFCMCPAEVLKLGSVLPVRCCFADCGSHLMSYSSWLHCVKIFGDWEFKNFYVIILFDVSLSCRYAKNVYMVAWI